MKTELNIHTLGDGYVISLSDGNVHHLY